MSDVTNIKDIAAKALNDMDTSDDESKNQEEKEMGERIERISSKSSFIMPLNNQNADNFNGRVRLFVTNLGQNVIKQEELRLIFERYGEVVKCKLHPNKGYARVIMDYEENARKAKYILHNNVFRGQKLKIIHDVVNMLKVKNLTRWVSNELLTVAFSVFGKIKRAVVIVDDKGESTGEGIVEFWKKRSAILALNECTKKSYMLTTIAQPVIVEPIEQFDDTNGLTDEYLSRTSPEYYTVRQIGPHFARSSLEKKCCTRWKLLQKWYEQKKQALEKEMAIKRKELEIELELYKFE